ncbi:MAG: MFS transporter [Spirochaetaceae bacterium]|jgi:fucose permease|nr:MFS transporter [Spirochaetaceae bacterium]
MILSKKNHILLLIIINGTMFLFGFVENIKGVSYPLIKTGFNVSYDDQGKMISLSSFVYTFFCVAAGFILARFGVKKVYLLGFVLLLAGLVFICLAPAFITVVFSLLFIFAGFGLFEIGVNGLAAQLFTKRAALLMSLLHFFYGLGAVAGPKLAGIFTGAAGPDFGWRQIYLYSIPLVFLFFIPAAAAAFPPSDHAAEDSSSKTSPAETSSIKPPSGMGTRRPRGLTFTGALGDPQVWIFGLALGLMMGIEMVSANWGGLYFQDVYGMDPRTKGAGFVSMFFILFTVSRLISGFFIERIGYMRSLVGAVFCIVVILILGFSLGEGGIYILPGLGFFIAILWPTFMAVGIGRFGKDAAVKTGAMIPIGGLLNALIQLSIGYINRYMGAAWGYRSALVFSAALLVILISIHRARK